MPADAQSTVGVVSDLHGNRVALDAVLSDMPDVDALLCAGDVVGYNPWPGECVEWVRERGVPTVMGNHDRAVATGDTSWFNSMAAAGRSFRPSRSTGSPASPTSATSSTAG